jgi:hypothetical protein
MFAGCSPRSILFVEGESRENRLRHGCGSFQACRLEAIPELPQVLERFGPDHHPAFAAGGSLKLRSSTGDLCIHFTSD